MKNKFFIEKHELDLNQNNDKMMDLFRIVSIVMLIVICSCGSSKEYEGHWVDRYSERRHLIIEKNNTGYAVTINNGKYAAFEEKGKLRIETQPPVNTLIDDNGMLLYGGISYMKIEDSMAVKGVGLWEKVSGKKNGSGENLKIEKLGKYFIVNRGDIVNDEFRVNRIESFARMEFDKGKLQGDYYAPETIKSSIELTDGLLKVQVGEKIEMFDKVK